jgi:hypothetical protein
MSDFLNNSLFDALFDARAAQGLNDITEEKHLKL